MQCYRAGKPVRNRLLELPVEQDEWIVIHGTADDMLARGYEPLADGEGRFRDPATDDIYQLARRERREASTNFIELIPEATLESELAVRDLTINAMALDEDDNLIDPFDGEADLRDGLLRHVTPHFARHPVNLLNIAVEAAQLVKWGFHVAHGTYGLLKRMVNEGNIQLLPVETWGLAIRSSLTGAATPSECFRVWQRCGALAVISPGLNRLYHNDESHQSNQSVPTAIAWLDKQINEGHDEAQILQEWRAQLGNEADSVYRELGL